MDRLQCNSSTVVIILFTTFRWDRTGKQVNSHQYLSWSYRNCKSWSSTTFEKFYKNRWFLFCGCLFLYILFVCLYPLSYPSSTSLKVQTAGLPDPLYTEVDDQKVYWNSLCVFDGRHEGLYTLSTFHVGVLLTWRETCRRYIERH